MSRFRGACLGLAAAIIGSWTVTASADVGSDATRLRMLWTTVGKIAQLKPRLLERGNELPVQLPPEVLDLNSRDCVTVAVLGPTSSHFILELMTPDNSPPAPADWPVASVAGAAEMTRCGGAKLALLGLRIEMRSPRGVLEILAVRSNARVPSVVQVLPHRDPGPLKLPAGPGHKSVNPPLDERARRLDERLRREGARQVERGVLPSRNDGSGEVILTLPAGCHRFDLLAQTGVLPNGRPEDIDMDVAIAGRSESLATDRADTIDASAAFCLGDQTPVRLRFVGAGSRAQVTLLRTFWELPDGLPEKWGALARGKIAQVLQTNGATIAGKPIYESLGVQGLTSLAVQTRAGGCYTAAIAALRGSTLGLHLAAQSGSSGAENRAAREGEGTVIAFCATSDSPTLFEIESRGVSLAWLLAVWETGSMHVGEVAP